MSVPEHVAQVGGRSNCRPIKWSRLTSEIGRLLPSAVACRRPAQLPEIDPKRPRIDLQSGRLACARLKNTTVDVAKYANPNSVGTERLTGPNTGLDRRKLVAGARVALAGGRIEGHVRGLYRMRNEHEVTCLDLDCLRECAACHEAHRIRMGGAIFFRYHEPASITPPMSDQHQADIIRIAYLLSYSNGNGSVASCPFSRFSSNGCPAVSCEDKALERSAPERARRGARLGHREAVATSDR